VRVEKARTDFLLFIILSSVGRNWSGCWATTPRARLRLQRVSSVGRLNCSAPTRDAHLDRPGQTGRLQSVRQ
jgi:hypothetical protein